MVCYILKPRNWKKFKGGHFQHADTIGHITLGIVETIEHFQYIKRAHRGRVF